MKTDHKTMTMRTFAAFLLTFFGIALPVLAQDVLTLGGAQCVVANPGQNATLPVYIRDVAGTVVGVDRGSGKRIQAFSFNVFPSTPSAITTDGSGKLAISISQAGITNSLGAPSFSNTPRTATSFGYIAQYDEASQPIPFNQGASAPGDRVANVTIPVSASAAPGSTIQLTLDPSSAVTLLSNQAGSFSETNGNGLTLVSGCISIPAPNLSLSLSPNAPSALAGNSVTETVTLSGTVSSATTISLSSSNPSVATVPSSVVVGAGQNSASFTITAVAPGTATITANAPASIGSGSASVQMTVTSASAPSITSLTPSSGPAAGGTTVTINGSNLTGATAVLFGSATATILTVNASSVVVVTPSRSNGGSVNVSVTTPNGTATRNNAFAYVAPSSPSILSITPVSGPTAGAAGVTISGANLGIVSGVTFGGLSAAFQQVGNDVTLTTPPHAAGSVDVIVQTSKGVATRNNGYTYVLAPTITSLTPDSGSISGGTSVTISGTDLEGASVKFDSVAATIVSASASSVVAIAPPHSAGVVSVTVTASGGIATRAGAFRYVPQPSSQMQILPVVGSLSGVGGSLFRTSVQLHNGSTNRAQGVLIFHPQGSNGVSTDPSLTYDLRPGETRSIADVLPEIGVTGIGSADLLPGSGAPPVAVVRIFNDAGSAGTTGMAIGTATSDELLQPGEHATLLVPGDLQAFRFNLGIRSAGEGATLDVTVRNASGAIKKTMTASYAPNYFVQLPASNLVGSLDANDSITFAVTSGAAVIYGASTDNRTQDPSYQVANDVTDVAGERPLIAVVGATNGSFGSKFRTSMQLHNPTGARIIGVLLFHPMGATSTDSDAALPYTLNAGETRFIPDVVGAMGTTGIGTLDVVPANGVAPLVVAQIFNDAGSAGTTGVQLKAASASEALKAGETGVLIAPNDPIAFRFNVGVRALGDGASITISLRDTGGRTVSTKTRTYGPNVFVQTSAADLITGALASSDVLSFTVNSGSAVIYGTTTDNLTQDPTYQQIHRTQ